MGPGMEQVLKDEIFCGIDYPVWRTRIMNLLKKKNLIHVLNKTIEEEEFFRLPENENNDDKEIREARLEIRIKDEETALELIQRRLDNKQFKLVLNVTSCKILLSKFDSLYKRSGPHVRAHLREQLMALKHQHHESLIDLFEDFDKIIRDMEAANYFLPKIEKIHYFLESIPNKYSQFVSYFEFMDDAMFENLSFCDMKNKFLMLN